jgi:hypothetical protein
MRLDLDAAPHRNPDDQEIACPHLYVYRDQVITELAAERLLF